MSQLRRVVQELATLERVQAELAAIAGRSDARRRHDLIALRREFAQQIAEVGRLADAMFAAAADRSLEQTYRDLFSRMRAAAAAHQANWPAVRIDEGGDQYRLSAVAVGEAHRAFVAWMRAALADLAQAAPVEAAAPFPSRPTGSAG